ncbi:MAG: hypothetical protein HYU67_02960 [Flavobacteriia bacterium]|nr:hypothetical protein [Flavobacteriia bacterium]
MKNQFVLNCLTFTGLLLLFSCNNDNKLDKKKVKIITPSSIKTDIKSTDDTLQHYYKLLMENKIEQIHPNHFINATQNYLLFYRKYPNDSFAPVCLDKAQQLYTQQKKYALALKYTDTLLKHYPNYKDNPTLLVNAGSICDAILNDRKKTQYYYQKLITQYPSIDKETKEMVEFRLKHIDLSFDEMIKLQSKK